MEKNQGSGGGGFAVHLALHDGGQASFLRSSFHKSLGSVLDVLEPIRNPYNWNKGSNLCFVSNFYNFSHSLIPSPISPPTSLKQQRRGSECIAEAKNYHAGVLRTGLISSCYMRHV